MTCIRNVEYLFKETVDVNYVHFHSSCNSFTIQRKNTVVNSAIISSLMSNIRTKICVICSTSYF